MLCLLNGRIHTNNPQNPSVEALAIHSGKIIAAGSSRQLREEFGSHIEYYDLQGRCVWPGLTDAHIHLEHYALSLTKVDCETLTQAECLRRVAEREKSTPAGEWVRGHGWNQNTWPEGFGSVKELDEISSDTPIYLTAKSLHASWANSAALRLAGVDSSTPDPQDGKIVRDDQGNPTGILLESAMEMIERAIPSPTQAAITQAIDGAQANLWQMGVTGVHDYDRAACFTALQILDGAGKLHLRVVKSIPLDLLAEAAALGLRTGFGSQNLRIGSVKLFADGALGPHTAAMLQPYDGDTDNTGILFLDNEQVFEHGQTAVAAGISMAIHAIGDRANHEVLNAYAQLRDFESQQGYAHLRHRIEHVQCLHPEDYTRLAQLNVIASVQPIHATSDMYMADRYWGSRSAGAYAFHTLLASGARLAFGSDAPVESPNPWLGLHAAVTRQRPDGSPGPAGWYPNQRLGLDDALQGYTTGPAFASGQENSLGKLSAGYFADLIVLDEDPFSIAPENLAGIKPAATMINGEWVWQRG